MARPGLEFQITDNVLIANMPSTWGVVTSANYTPSKTIFFNIIVRYWRRFFGFGWPCFFTTTVEVSDDWWSTWSTYRTLLKWVMPANEPSNLTARSFSATVMLEWGKTYRAKIDGNVVSWFFFVDIDAFISSQDKKDPALK